MEEIQRLWLNNPPCQAGRGREAQRAQLAPS
jgi:hypothetical protein